MGNLRLESDRVDVPRVAQPSFRCSAETCRESLLVENQRQRQGEVEHREAFRAESEWQDLDGVPEDVTVNLDGTRAMCATTHETMRGVNAIWGNSQSLGMVDAAFYYNLHHLCDPPSASLLE